MTKDDLKRDLIELLVGDDEVMLAVATAIARALARRSPALLAELRCMVAETGL